MFGLTLTPGQVLLQVGPNHSQVQEELYPQPKKTTTRLCSNHSHGLISL